MIIKLKSSLKKIKEKGSFDVNNVIDLYLLETDIKSLAVIK